MTTKTLLLRPIFCFPQQNIAIILSKKNKLTYLLTLLDASL